MPAKSGIAALPPVDGLLVELTAGVLTLTLNQPETLNALTAPVVAGLADALEAAATDPRVRVVRLGGAGRGFSSGAGLSRPEGAEAPPPLDVLIEGNRAVRAIIDLPRPVVAVVQGPAAGIGVSLALACDLVIAAEEAYFLLAFTKIGLMPDGGATALVAASVGRARAMKMALLAERLHAADALAAGLIAAVHPAEELPAAADELVSRLLAGPVVAYGNTKLAINAAALPELDAAIARETAWQHRLLQADDQREGIAAFLERRAPKFTDC
ncbi:enoyl-CoA hydratase [Mycolicibacterium brumae]|uniref:Enoyl-CoA hydratase n=1 Tax=Mycolicibacterium brumae TaxID=85968 RepID=A0A2G5PEM1_9MYCO|nr:enoyl-CoA hydratase [Mycolicibacterium brumae]MCV7192038.1 enoyl-CoA hydratase [Mycolicibacterium brumae]PIB76759.1 enoyl-CoA hydratase [Mycolicibacterium brumae]RWA20704.1 hypothetical protein MBRU_03330 [Mycolicibacterium brumae DSM 44177]UWW07803.1 enoyl-CoA hydratase [Mycolicibacterium brumae]